MHKTKSPYHLPEIGKRLAAKAKREGVAEHFPAPRVRKTLEVDSSLIDPYAKFLGEVELYLTRRAKAHAGPTFARLHSVPGIGQILALVLVYEIPAMRRFPRVHEFGSSCRRGKGAKESKGKRLGTAGQKMGTVQLRWACAEAAVLFLRQSQPGKESVAKLDHKHGKATALTVLAHQLGRAVYSRRTREPAVALQRVVTASPLRLFIPHILPT